MTFQRNRKGFVTVSAAFKTRIQNIAAEYQRREGVTSPTLLACWELVAGDTPRDRFLATE